MKISQIVVNGQLISFLANYENNKQAQISLVFLHGWRSRKEVWSPVIQKLLVMNYQLSVYSMDLPGFGGSQWSQPLPNPPLKRGGKTAGMTVGDYAEVAKGFIEKLELKNVVLVGHSFGGRVGIKLAAMYPQLLSKLVLVDSAGFAISQNKKSAMNFAAKIAKPFFAPKFMQGLRKKIYQKIGAEDYLATPQLQKTFVNVVGEDLTSDMQKINCPTLIIFGENDKETPPSTGLKMQILINSIPSSDGMALSHDRAKFQILTRAGHFSFLDEPEEFVKNLIEFI